MNEAVLFALQRLTAKLLAPLVVVHLVLILYAVHGGLSAAEILGRTQGSAAWGAFYGLFVLAVAVHAPVGVRNVVREWTRWRGRSLDVASVGLAIVLLALGLRAVAAVVG
ncbi:MAG: succinate dehydrogenase [Chromatiales bacterium]|nr:succinate dehydrogenase [Chromatiales bacterium]